MKRRALTLIICMPFKRLYVCPKEQTLLWTAFRDDRKAIKKQSKRVYANAFFAGLKPDCGSEP